MITAGRGPGTGAWTFGGRGSASNAIHVYGRRQILQTRAAAPGGVHRNFLVARHCGTVRCAHAGQAAAERALTLQAIALVVVQPYAADVVMHLKDLDIHARGQ